MTTTEVRTYFSSDMPNLIKYTGDAGYDLRSSVDGVVAPNSRVCIPTSLHMSIPQGYYGQIFPRSGLAVNYSIDVGAGVIDASYRGEVKVLLINSSSRPFNVSRGDRIAQIVLIKILEGPTTRVDNLNELGDTIRGSSGFGSTGIA